MNRTFRTTNILIPAMAILSLAATACSDVEPSGPNNVAPDVGSGGSDAGAGGSVGEGASGGSPSTGGAGGADTGCADGLQGGEETDVDCGGAVCGPCDNGKACIDGADCASGGCDSGTCGAWSATFSSMATDRINTVAIALNGDVIVAGTIQGPIDLGCGGLLASGLDDIVVARLSPHGSCIWSKSFGSSGTDSPSKIAVTSTDHVVVYGNFSGAIDFGGGALTSLGLRDLVVFELDATGAHVWSKRFGGAGEDVSGGMAIDGNGDMFLTGLVRSGSITFGGNQLDNADPNPVPIWGDAFLVKLTGTGNHVWSKIFGGASPDGDDRGLSVAVDPSGDVGIGGLFRETINFGGGTLSSLGLGDCFIAKLNGANGSHKWSMRYGTALNESVGAGIAFDASGALFIAGYANLGTDLDGQGPLPGTIMVAKYSDLGTHLWSRGFSSNYARSVAVDPSGDVVVSGELAGSAVTFDSFTLTNTGGQDGYVLRLDGATGTAQGVVGFFAANLNTTDMALDLETGNVLVTGGFTGTINLGDGSHTSAGSDGYLASLGRAP